MKYFDAKLEKLENQLWSYHVMIPLEIVSYFKVLKTSRFICIINKTTDFPCAMMPAGDGKYFIMINAEIRASLGIKIGDVLNVGLKGDTSVYGMPLPIELEEIFLQEPQFDYYFHQLTPGKQRALI